MAESYINVAPDVVGQSVPETVEPVATFTIGGKDIQRVMSGPTSVPYDHIKHTWSGGNVTQIVYRLGGSSGTIMLTVDYTYDGDGNVDEISYTYGV